MRNKILIGTFAFAAICGLISAKSQKQNTLYYYPSNDLERKPQIYKIDIIPCPTIGYGCVGHIEGEEQPVQFYQLIEGRLQPLSNEEWFHEKNQCREAV